MSNESIQIQDQRKAALVNRWPDFFTWLKETYGFHIESVVPGKEQHCPVHGGDSGEAFRFFDDFDLTGGGICNSGCIKMATGDKLVSGWLSKLREANAQSYASIASSVAGEGQDPESLAGSVIDAYLAAKGIDLPPPRVGMQVSRWANAIDTRIALKYLSHRGLTFTPKNLPKSIRGSKRYWAHPNYKKATALLGLVYGVAGTPVTHQCILTNRNGEKLGTRPEDDQVLQLMSDGKARKPAVKKLATLQQQEDLSFRYVPLGEESATDLLLGEGIETVLAGRKIYEFREKSTPAARAMVGSPYQNQIIPDHVKRVFALIDNDHTIDRAQEELEYLATEYKDKEFFMVVPSKWTEADLKAGGITDPAIPKKGKDWLDTYVRYPEAVCSEYWDKGLRKVKATGISRSDLGSAQGSTPAQPAFNRPAVGAANTHDKTVQVPLSDVKFFANLNRFLKGSQFNWMKCAHTGQIFTIVEGQFIPLDRDSIVAELAQEVRFIPETTGGFRGGNVKEVPFPEERIYRWTKTSGYRHVLESKLTAVESVNGCLQVVRDNNRWNLQKGTGVLFAPGRYQVADSIHQSALARAEDWLRLCEDSPELVLVDVEMLNRPLADHIRKSGLARKPSALARITSILLLNEVVQPRFESKEHLSHFCAGFFEATGGVRPAYSCDLLFSLVEHRIVGLPPQLDPSEDPTPKSSVLPSDVREAILGVLYLVVAGWCRYSSTANTPANVTANILSWCELDFSTGASGTFKSMESVM